MLIGIDFDDVIYPYHDYLKARIRDAYHVDLSARRVTSFYYDDLPDLQRAGATRDDVWRLVQETWMDETDHAQASPLDASVAAAVKALRREHRVILVTARAESSRPHVETFLARVGIQVDDVVLGRTDKTGYDVLVDDFPQHAIENAAAGGWSVLYTIDENSTFDETRIPRVVRAESWREVVAHVRRIQERTRHA